MIDLASLTLPELQQLQRDIAKEIPKRKAEEKKNAMADLEMLAAERGFTLSELLHGDLVRNGKHAPRKPAAIKYVNPADTAQTWTGRGRKPAWVVQHLTSGGTLQSLEV